MSQPIDKDYLILHYSRLTDEELKRIANSDLVPESMTLLQAEIDRRPIERKRERDEAAALDAQLQIVNEERLAAGQVPLDGSGKPVINLVFGVGAARSTCLYGIFISATIALVTLRESPSSTFLCVTFATWAYWIRRRLSMNLRHAAIEFIAYTTTVGLLIIFLALPSIDDSFLSLRGSSLRGLGFLSIGFLWQLLVAGVIVIQLLRKRFLSVEAILSSNNQ